MRESVLLSETTAHKELSIGIFVSLLLHGILITIILISPSMSKSKEYQVFRSFHVRLIRASEINETVPVKRASGQTRSYVAERKHGKRKPVIPVYEVKKIKLQNKSDSKQSKNVLKPLEPSEQAVTKLEQEKQSNNLAFWKRLIPEIHRRSAGKPIKQRSKIADSESSTEYGLARRLYYSEVWRAIQKQWALPVELLKRKDLEAIVIIKVRRDGTIVDMKFEKKSGNQIFDESVWNAIKKANPLPPFPKIYSPPYEEFGIRFRPENLAQLDRSIWRMPCAA